jgi:acid stress chaperone HdeB
VRNMKSIVAGLLFCLMTTSFARAQMTIDVSQITCKQFMVSTLFEPDHIALWLNGYYNGIRGNTVIDVGGLQDYVAGVKDYCQHNQGAAVMKAAETLLGAGK